MANCSPRAVRRARAAPESASYTREHGNRVFVTRLADEGPGGAAGVAAGDIIVAVDGKPVRGQIDFYCKIWALGGLASPSR